MRLCVAGAYGAFGTKHLEALDNIDDVTVTSVMGPKEDKIDALAKATPDPNPPLEIPANTTAGIVNAKI